MVEALMFGKWDARYHPLYEPGEKVKELLAECCITMTDRPEAFESEAMKQYRLCILYGEFEEPAFGDGETAGLLSFVSTGGGLLVLHNGISVQSRSELGQMIGGEFLSHPPYEQLPVLHYKGKAAAHPVMEGVSDFCAEDEAYQFRLDPLADIQIVMEYQYEGKSYPAAWVRRYGKGRVAYCCAGHNGKTFENPEFGKWIRNSAAWLLSEQEEG